MRSEASRGKPRGILAKASRLALSSAFLVFGLMTLSLGACDIFLPGDDEHEEEHKCKDNSNCPQNYWCDKTKTVWECKPIDCTPECTDKCCGDDGCDGTCPDNCAAGYHCDPTTCRCTTDCIPQCTDKCCGDDGCDGTCPDNCTAGYHCNITTCRCTIDCTPECTDKCCGDDGCDGTCPDNCTAGYHCNLTACLCASNNCTDPVNQIGCDAGENCIPVGDALVCVTAGGGGQGDPCDGHDDCRVGFMCVMKTPTDIFCAKICNFVQQTGCPSGWTCLGWPSGWGVCAEDL